MRADRLTLDRAAIAGLAARFFLMGVLVAAYGPLVQVLSHRFGLSVPVAGTPISVSFAGSLAGVFAAMWMLGRAPARVPVLIATTVASLGLAAVAVAPTWPLFLASVFVTGSAFGILVIALNQVVAYSEGRRRAALLNALSSCYSIGAVAAPLLVAGFARDHFAALYLVAAAAWLAVLPTALGISGRLPAAGAPSRRPGVLVGLFICAFLLYVAVENGIAGWMTTHLLSTGLDLGGAATVTSGFWVALFLGRLLMTLVPPGVSEAKIVLAGSALAAAALLCAAIPAAAPYAYLAAGLAMAPIFPTAVVWLARLRPGDARATSWIYAATAVGGVAGPGVIGVVIASAGVAWAPAVLGSVAAVMVAAFGVASRRSTA